jgi:hypothetical protein
MFKQRTLFVLGAGASAEADLPIGAKLAKNVSGLLTVDRDSPENQEGERLLVELYARYPLPDNGYHRAAGAISEGVLLTNSIDDYLDRHSHDELIQRVGKLAIVKSILTAERKSRLMPTSRGRANIEELDDTWYSKFFRMLGARVNVGNAPQIFDNVKFIVFNYDRCLEHFLVDAIRSVYGMSESEAVSTVTDCDIIHPYGVIAELPFRGAGIPFGGAESFEDDCVTSSAGIKIFTEQIAGGEMLQQLHDKLFWAEQIVFLGFGYLDENMTLLRPGKQMSLKPVFGTAHDMSGSNIEGVKNKLAHFFTGGRAGILPAMLIENRKCVQLLDDYAIRLTS